MTDSAPAGRERVIWRGRAGLDHPGFDGALDGWNCGRTALSARLADAGELVVVDALSFPWEQLSDTDRDIPLVLVLPESLDAGDIRTVLDRPVLRHLTPYDVLLEARPEVRDEIGATYRLAPEQWVSLADHSAASVYDALRARAEARLARVETPFGTFVAPSGDLITGHLLDFGAHQRGTLNALLGLLDDGQVVWDVGAHIGTLSIPLLASGRAASGLAVEADPGTAALLRRNLAENGHDGSVEVIEAVVGDAAPTDPKHPTDPNDPGSAEFVPSRVGGNTGATAFLPGRSATGSTLRRTARIAGVRLDDLRADRPAPTVVKIDVEGAEVGVLRGAARILTDDRPTLVVEVAPEQLARHRATVGDLADLLAGHDYVLLRIAGERNHDGTGYEIAEVESLAGVEEELFDVLAVPRESALAATPVGAADAPIAEGVSR